MPGRKLCDLRAAKVIRPSSINENETFSRSDLSSFLLAEAVCLAKQGLQAK